jgi:hypothetical protein
MVGWLYNDLPRSAAAVWCRASRAECVAARSQSDGYPRMPNRPPLQRFKSDMPQIPGVSAQTPARTQPGFKPVRLLGFLSALVFCLLLVRWAMLPRVPEASPVAPTPKIDIPPPAADANVALPHATELQPGIASVDEMARPWTSKDFFYKNRLSGENLPAVLVRLPGSANQPASYWAFSVKAPFGNCTLEYVADIEKLRTDYGFRAAKHPMVGNPCSRAVFDPLKMMNIPGGAWVRGAIAQGSDLRPPLGIEIEIRGKQIMAARME